MFLKLAVAALLSLYGMVEADNVDNVNAVMICDQRYYADGAIYRSASGSGLGSFPATTSFSLNLATSAHSGAPLDPILPAQNVDTHEYKALNEQLYIDASPDAYAPVGFVAGGNATLSDGKTTWGFFSPYGFFIWYRDASTASGPVHAQGFEWVPVDGYPDLTKLYWNQTQYDAAARGDASVDASKAAFGLCAGDASPTVSWA